MTPAASDFCQRNESFFVSFFLPNRTIISTTTMVTTTSTPLISPDTASAAASTGLSFLNAAHQKILAACTEGPFTFRMLGFLGGLAMIVSNALSILSRFFAFNFAGALLAMYGVCFGVLIVILEGPFPFKERLQSGLHFYANFLDFTWGRGALFLFCGSLQASNWNMLDWAVGGFMMFVGVTAIGVGIAAAVSLRQLKLRLADESKLKEKFASHDRNGDGKLDVKEVTSFVSDAGVEMNRNEIAAIFLALGAYMWQRCFSNNSRTSVVCSRSHTHCSQIRTLMNEFPTKNLSLGGLQLGRMVRVVTCLCRICTQFGRTCAAIN